MNRATRKVQVNFIIGILFKRGKLNKKVGITLAAAIVLFALRPIKDVPFLLPAFAFHSIIVVSLTCTGITGLSLFRSPI